MCTISSAIFNSRKLYIANGKNYHKKMNKMMKKITYERLNDVCFVCVCVCECVLLLQRTGSADSCVMRLVSISNV